jgi:hypothetical protein
VDQLQSLRDPVAEFEGGREKIELEKYKNRARTT